MDAPPYIGINLTVNGKAIFSPNLSFRRQPSANRIERLARPKEKVPKANEDNTIKSGSDTVMDLMDSGENTTNAESDTSKGENDAKMAETNVRESRMTGAEYKVKDNTSILKLKENNLTLNYGGKKGVSEPLLKNVKQSRSIVLNTYSTNETKRWKPVQVLESERKPGLERAAQLKTLSIDANAKTSAKNTFENRFLKTKNKRKASKKLKLSREQHADNNVAHVDKSRSHVNKCSDHVDTARSAPTRTILRYTDKRFGQAKTVAIDMGPETKLQKNMEVVIN